MKLLRLIAPMMMCVILVGAITIPANAQSMASTSENIQSRFSDTRYATAGIRNSGTTITATIVVSPDYKTTLTKGKMHVQEQVNGIWKTVKSWDINQTGTVGITKTYTGKKGSTYRTQVVVQVGRDNINAVSNSIVIK